MIYAKNLDDHNQRKNTLLQILDNLQELAEEANLKSTAGAIMETAEKLKNQRFRIIVVGEFSRGKSTFINALLGDDVLPSSVLPTTATINLIKYAEKKYVTILYKNGDTKNSAIDVLKILDAARSEENELIKNEIGKIKFLQFFYPTDYGKDGVEILDTPGVNDIDKLREDITLGIIPTSDAAILDLDANQPISGSEQVFLKERLIKNDISKIFAVINKIDQIEECERTATIEYITKELARAIKNPKVYPLSSLICLEGKMENDSRKIQESQMLSLENDLTHFLANEKGKLILKNPCTRAMNSFNEIYYHYDMKIKYLDAPLTELEGKKRCFEISRHNADTKFKILSQEVHNFFINFSDNLINSLEIMFNDFYNDMINYSNAYGQPNLNELKNYIMDQIRCFFRELIEYINDYIYSEFNAFIPAVNIKLKGILNEFSGYSNLSVENVDVDLDDEANYAASMINQINANVPQNQNSVVAPAALIGMALFGPLGAIVGGIMADGIEQQNQWEQVNQIKAYLTDNMYKAINETYQSVVKKTKTRIYSLEQQFINNLGYSYNGYMESINNAISGILYEKNRYDSQKAIIFQKISKLDELKKRINEIKNCIQ